MASLAKLKKQLFAELDEKFGDGALTEELATSLLKVVQNLGAMQTNNEEDDEPEVVTKPKRSKLKTVEPEDDDEEPEADADDEDENNDDDGDEPAPVKKNSGAKKVTKPVAKPAAKAAAKPVSNSFENADFADAEVSVKEMAETIGLNLKKAKVAKDADVRKLLKSIQAMSKKKPVTYFEKLAGKADVIIVQPKGRTTDQKRSRVAIVALINAGHSPITAA